MDKMDELVLTDMSDYWDKEVFCGILGTKAVQIPQIGTFVEYQGKSYVILTTATFQEETGICTILDILRVTDEGDDAGEPSIKVIAADLRLI